MDTVFAGGMVLDGLGNPPKRQDIAITGDRISLSVSREDRKSARRVIDCSGLYISPGFINIHSHSDIPFILDGRVPSSLYQGITTEVVGNCGYSASPVSGPLVKETAEDLKRYEISLDWTDPAGYFRRVEEKGIWINLIALIGHGNLRGCVMGMEMRKALPSELEQMKILAESAMDQGVWGLSTGLIYPPSSYGDADEISEIAAIIARRGGFYATHIRGEGASLIPAIQEAIDIAKRAEIRLEISHMKSAGSENWGKVNQVLEMVRTAREGGLFVQQDQYPYTMSATSLCMVVPEWAQDGGNDEFIRRMKAPDTREKLKEEMAGDSYIRNGGIIISAVKTEKNRIYEGRDVRELAESEGKELRDFILDLLIEESASVGAIYASMCEDDVRTVMRDFYTSVCTDADASAVEGILKQGRPHPRTYGSFPRVLARYCREEKVLTLENAIRKMTSLPARMLGLKDRGIIADGLKADLVVFDPDNIRDTATMKEPHSYSRGIEYIMVNGSLALEKGETAPVPAGRVLRRTTEGI